MKKSFTFVEVLVVSAIMLILIGLLATALIQMRSVFETTDVLVKLQENCRLAINRISQELRLTSQGEYSITQNYPSSGTDKIVYHLPKDSDNNGEPDYNINGTIWDDTDITISLDPDNPNTLIKIIGTKTTVLANNVKKINFKDHSIDASLYLDELQVILKMEKTSYEGRTYNFTSTSVINMRD